MIGLGIIPIGCNRLCELWYACKNALGVDKPSCNMSESNHARGEVYLYRFEITHFYEISEMRLLAAFLLTAKRYLYVSTVTVDLCAPSSPPAR